MEYPNIYRTINANKNNHTAKANFHATASKLT